MKKFALAVMIAITALFSASAANAGYYTYHPTCWREVVRDYYGYPMRDYYGYPITEDVCG